MRPYTAKNLLLVLTPYIATCLIVIALFVDAAVAEGSGFVAGVIYSLILVVIGLALILGTLGILGGMLANNKRALYSLATLESLVGTAVLWVHIVPSGTDSWSWALITVPFMLGTASFAVIMIGVIVALVLRKRQINQPLSEENG
jgi:hypothetical protein